MKRVVRLTVGLVLMAALFVGGVYLQLSHYLETSRGGEFSTTTIVSRGTTLKPLLEDLAARAILDKPRWLYYYARATGQTEIRAGEYELKSSQTPTDILATLREGRVKLETFTIAEGLNRWQVRDLLAKERWLPAASFDKLCDDVKFLEAYAIPGPTCEGYLFPETYTFARGVTPEKVFAALFAGFQRAFDSETKAGKGPLDLAARELVTLASIVEKETGAADERPHIACVFYNRLRAKPRWRLDTDPTVIYAATLSDPTFDGNLRAYHLRQMEHPYNTYKIYGLPPGPIANPGNAALAAVVSPAACDDYFFVSMNNGRHEFCKTLDCHNRAVERWQKSHGAPR
ncbi:MAG: endolytic transglycosylase MltG [Deltaproteobacteria bacterium]|nr:endolytic transglycosylase MltG [Deltaproteobacteria bacterium]